MIKPQFKEAIKAGHETRRS